MEEEMRGKESRTPRPRRIQQFCFTVVVSNLSDSTTWLHCSCIIFPNLFLVTAFFRFTLRDDDNRFHYHYYRISYVPSLWGQPIYAAVTVHGADQGAGDADRQGGGQGLRRCSFVSPRYSKTMHQPWHTSGARRGGASTLQAGVRGLNNEA